MKIDIIKSVEYNSNYKIMIDNRIKSAPSTRYQGSKRRILPWLCKNIKDLEFDTVLDGFGGTGSVSYLFKLMGKQVTFFPTHVEKKFEKKKKKKMEKKHIYQTLDIVS